MLRRIWLGVGLSISLLFVHQYAWSLETTPTINTAIYDIYVGDIDNNGFEDFYFKAKPLFLILHGQIATPLLIPRMGMDLMVTRINNTYSAPTSSTFTDLQIIAKIQSSVLRLAQVNIDYVVVNASSVTLRGVTVPIVNTYTYDALGRVINASDSVNGDRTYNYDAAGNRKNVTVSPL